MVHPDSVGLLDAAISNGKTILMADNSQESRYNINDVEQQFTVGHSKVRATYSNTFTIKIAEPDGTTFLESIALSAAQLNIQNHMLARYFLTIQFIGRMPDGSAKRHPSKFVYPIVFQDIQMAIDAGGSQYSITAIEQNSSAFSYLEQVVKTQITLEANNVGEFISELMRKYQTSLENELLFNINAAYSDTYEITFDTETGTDEWESWPIQQASEALKNLGPSKIGDKIHFTIPNGSNLADITSMVLQSTAEYKKIVNDEGGFMKSAPGDPANADLDKFPVFYKVIPKVKMGLFDPLRRDYVKEITFKIKKHIVVDRVMDTVQYRDGITESTIQKNRISKMFSRNLLRKRYDYIFTGLNTEIMQLDLTLNNQYYEISVVGNGQVGDPGNQSTTAGNAGATLHDQIKTTKNSLILANRNIQKFLTGKDGKGIASSAFLGADAFIAKMEEEIAGIRSELEERLKDFADGLNGLDVELTGTNGGGSFLSQEQSSGSISMPIRFGADIVDDSDIYGPENDTSGGVLQFGAVKSNLENSADMLAIEMGIRGDPYWMGMPNSFYRSGPQSTELADYEIGGILFFLNVKFPISEDSSGRRTPRDDYTVSGTYRVVDVISRFSGGLFTQHINAVRDTSTNTATVLSTLQEPQIELTSAAFDNHVNANRIYPPQDAAQNQENQGQGGSGR